MSVIKHSDIETVIIDIERAQIISEDAAFERDVRDIGAIQAGKEYRRIKIKSYKRRISLSIAFATT